MSAPNPATVAAMDDRTRPARNWSAVWLLDVDTAAEVADRLIAEAVAAERQRILDAIALVQVRHEDLRHGVQTGTPMAFHHNAIAGFCRTEAWQIVTGGDP